MRLAPLLVLLVGCSASGGAGFAPLAEGGAAGAPPEVVAGKASAGDAAAGGEPSETAGTGGAAGVGGGASPSAGSAGAPQAGGPSLGGAGSGSAGAPVGGTSSAGGKPVDPCPAFDCLTEQECKGPGFTHVATAPVYDPRTKCYSYEATCYPAGFDQACVPKACWTPGGYCL